ncbi:hypothetical protein QBC41DRAFT_95201 [Cercophora samala]|uniref:Uncharacterized protein n=1 Tax=Cercophora samala TaxID=330535 RepID=A0AA39ZG12_9PEZI|nr:hypothetical protein QBC41DRAFT_95201 [Cercophora samala]
METNDDGISPMNSSGVGRVVSTCFPLFFPLVVCCCMYTLALVGTENSFCSLLNELMGSWLMMNISFFFLFMNKKKEIMFAIK